MKKSKFSDSQILSILKQAGAGISVPDLCREHGSVQLLFINGERNLAGWIYR